MFHPRDMLRIENKWHALAVTFGIWLFSMVILVIDDFSLDYALMVTLVVAVFGFILNLSIHLARIEQKVDDLPCQECLDKVRKR